MSDQVRSSDEGRWESTLQVLSRARDGDRSAVGILIGRALPRLRRWTRGRLPEYGRGAADTEDLVQEAVLRTLKRADRFEHRSVASLQAYLRQTVVNRIRDVIRKVRRHGTPVEATDDLAGSARSPLEEAILRQSTARFLKALEALKPADRQAVIWRIELEYSYDEIARRLGKPSAAAARMTVGRALRRLATALAIDETLT